MRFSKKADAICNVVLPVLFGTFCYLPGAGIPLPVKNHFPDALWAYALISALLITWERRLPLIWLLAGVSGCFAFEWLQHERILNGTGDVLDLVVYLIAISSALLLNPFFRSLLIQNTSRHEPQKKPG